MRVALAQIKTNPGDIQGNIEKIKSYIENAKSKGVDLIVFPELAIPGYMSMDLILKENFVDDNILAMESLIECTEGIGVIIGFIDIEDKYNLRPDGLRRRYNSAAYIDDGKFIGSQSKTLLPDYDVFFENRYFDSAKTTHIFNIGKYKFGIEICEDMWSRGYFSDPSERFRGNGIDFIVNISASPFHENKMGKRLSLISGISKSHHVPFIYTNCVGGQDGYDGELVFEGRSVVSNSEGDIVRIGKAFEEEMIIIDNIFSTEKIEVEERDDIKDMHDALVCGIKDYFSRNGFTKAVIGLSGGIDSAVVAALATKAIGAENVVGVTMPSDYSSTGSIFDSYDLAINLGIKFNSVPIKNAVQSISFTIDEDSKNNKFCGKIKGTLTEENLQARIRAIILMSYSNSFGNLVLSTGNKTEMALGYCTLGGDMMGGLSPISDLNKLEVYEIARFINKINNKEIIPRNTIEKPPSAELAPDQTDERGLGAGYDILAPLVDELVDGNYNREELITRYPEKIVDDCIRRFRNQEYKRRQAAPGIKVAPKTFGIGRRIPMSHNYLK